MNSVLLTAPPTGKKEDKAVKNEKIQPYGEAVKPIATEYAKLILFKLNGIKTALPQGLSPAEKSDKISKELVDYLKNQLHFNDEDANRIAGILIALEKNPDKISEDKLTTELQPIIAEKGSERNRGHSLALEYQVLNLEFLNHRRLKRLSDNSKKCYFMLKMGDQK